MGSHHEWAEEVTAQHDAQKPYAPENGQPLRFKAGDPVIYTNPAGIEFPLRVTGFYQRPASPCGQYANGARYLLDWDCPWFPVPESRLRLDESRAIARAEAALATSQPDASMTREYASRDAELEQARAEEREACAKLCDSLVHPSFMTNDPGRMWILGTTDCAAAIRANGYKVES